VATLLQWWEGHARRLPSSGAPADVGARKPARPHWP